MGLNQKIDFLNHIGPDLNGFWSVRKKNIF
jgi:hypothetical protein